MDETSVKQKMLPGCLILLVVALSFYAIRSNNLMVGMLLLSVPIGIGLIMHPVLTATLVPVFYYSKLMLPGIPGSFLIAYMLMMICIAGWMGSVSLHRTHRNNADSVDGFVAAFALVLVAHMAIRGFSIRLMGGMEYGGMGYIFTLLWIGFYFASRTIPMPERTLQSVLPWICVGISIPSLLLIVVYIRPSLYGPIARFTTTSFDYITGAIQAGEMGKGRWGEASLFAEWIAIYALVARFKRKAMLKRLALIGFAGALVLVSGFRSGFAQIVLIIGLWIMLKSRNKILSLGMFGAALVGFWIFAVLFASYLPENIQRTVSFLPGVAVEGETLRRAVGSVDWRVGLWKYAATRIPEYLLIGRGLVIDISSAAWMQRSFYFSPEFGYLMGNYHSGPLSLILTYGLFGTIAWLGFSIAGIRRGVIALKKYRTPSDDYVRVLLLFSTMYLGISLFLFIFVMGEVRASFPSFILWLIFQRWCILNLSSRADGGTRQARV